MSTHGMNNRILHLEFALNTSPDVRADYVGVYQIEPLSMVGSNSDPSYHSIRMVVQLESEFDYMAGYVCGMDNGMCSFMGHYIQILN
jgi:hypothetical protein